MKTRIARRVAVTVGAAALMTAGGTAPADAGTVLNRFERSCYWGCSRFVQTNGAYVGSFGSVCVTKSWRGTTSYTVGPWRSC